MEYEAIYTRITVKPVKDPIFSERLTHIEIEDEAAGCFVEIRQAVDGPIQIDDCDWPLIRDAVDTMMAECTRLNAQQEED